MQVRARGLQLDVLLLGDGQEQARRWPPERRPTSACPWPWSPRPRSPGAACAAGFRQVLNQGQADLVVTLDATGQRSAAQIRNLVDQLCNETWT